MSYSTCIYILPLRIRSEISITAKLPLLSCLWMLILHILVLAKISLIWFDISISVIQIPVKIIMWNEYQKMRKSWESKKSCRRYRGLKVFWKLFFHSLEVMWSHLTWSCGDFQVLLKLLMSTSLELGCINQWTNPSIYVQIILSNMMEKVDYVDYSQVELPQSAQPVSHHIIGIGDFSDQFRPLKRLTRSPWIRQ